MADTALTQRHADRTATPGPRRPRVGLRLGLLWGLAGLLVVVYLSVGVSGNWAYILERRSTTVLTMIVVGIAIALSTVVFHTISANQILTPSIMGFDSLYLLIQTVAVAALGVRGLVGLNPLLEFAGQLVVMLVCSLLLYWWLLGRPRGLHLLVLVGVVIGGLFRSVSSFIQRLLDPTQFIVLQDRFFADFNSAPIHLVLLCAGMVVVVGALLWRSRAALDVTGLGRDVAIGLGVDHRRMTLLVLVAVAVLVSASTALVGPTSFFGLLVAHLAYQLLGTNRHAFTLPGAAAGAIICLVGGQLLFERVLGFEGSLSMVVEFCGGIVFIALLLRKARS